MPSDTTDALDQ